MKDVRVSVVILNWNGLNFLQQFLPNVVEHSSAHAEVIVADNASTDSSLEWVKENFPNVKTLSNLENAGYAGGYNWALKLVDADYYILLNSDVEVTQDWIPPIINMMQEDFSIAACQPKILKYGDSQYFEYAGAAGGYIDKFGYPFCRGRIFQHVEKDEGQYDDIADLFWATGATLFVRAKVFHELGGFDADFFAHMEEIDLCWRMKNAGYRIMYNGFSKVFHVGGGTLSAESPQKTYLNMRNNIIMLYKNLPSDKIFFVFVVRLVLDGIAAIKFLFDGGFRNFYAVARAHCSFYRRLKSSKAKRRKIKHNDVNQIYRGNIVFDYFLRKKRYFSDLSTKRF